MDRRGKDLANPSQSKNPRTSDSGALIHLPFVSDLFPIVWRNVLNKPRFRDGIASGVWRVVRQGRREEVV